MRSRAARASTAMSTNFVDQDWTPGARRPGAGRCGTARTDSSLQFRLVRALHMRLPSDRGPTLRTLRLDEDEDWVSWAVWTRKEQLRKTTLEPPDKANDAASALASSGASSRALSGASSGAYTRGTLTPLYSGRRASWETKWAIPPKKNELKRVAATGTLAFMFQHLLPLFKMMVVFGLLPTSLKDWTLCFHPLRSTLLFVLAVNALSLWTGWKVVQDSLEVLADEHTPVTLRFLCAINLSMFTIYPALPILWVESIRLKDIKCALKKVYDHLSHVLHSEAWPRPQSRRNVKLGVLYVMVVGPGSAVTLNFFMAGERDQLLLLLHLPAQMYCVVIVLSFSACCIISFLFIRDLAVVYSERFVQELSRGMTAAALSRYRHGWLALRALVELMPVMPVVITMATMYVLFLGTLCSYQVLVSIAEGYRLFPLLMTLMSSQIFLIFASLCTAADHVILAVTKGFQEPLENLHCQDDEAFTREARYFREVIQAGPKSFSVGGFWTLNRAAVISVLSTVLTYLIVLIQFGGTDEAPVSNSTSTGRN